MPLIRYRSSDLSSLVDGQCECGISMGRLAKIRSRCDEMVVCGMGNVGPWVFDDVLRGIGGIGQDWQVVIGHAGSRDLVTLHVEEDDTSQHGAIETRIHHNLRDRFADFWRNREMQLYELRVMAHPFGSLRGDARKLRRVVDERLMNHSRSAVSA
jgi:phenylacetate-CoA ligase